MSTGEKLKELRIKNGLTLEEVGNYVGVGKSTVRKWETGQIANMRRDKIAKLAEIYGVSPMDIINLEDNDSPVTESQIDEFSRLSAQLTPDQKKEAAKYLKYLLSTQ